jgi:predicted RNA-binding protein (virulence factor B family)
MNSGDFVALKVVAIEEHGAYLDWGKPKQLLLPRQEQRGSVAPGKTVVVCITEDRSGRPLASMRWDNFLEHDPTQLEVNQRVDLLIVEETEIGYKAIINSEHLGVLYYNEVFQPLHYGQRVTGYIKKIRHDGKVDLILTPTGTRGTPDLAERILQEVEARDGFLPLPEKSEPDAIYDLFGVSKKKYKMALGDLYKNRKVTLHDDGVRLA